MTSRAWVGAFCLVAAASCGEDAPFVASESEELAEVAQETPDPAPVAPPADELVDLLHTVDAIVSVSSKVANAKDFPEHLVDGKPETAWNSKTGDVNGWIAFRVPEQSRVTRVEITAGYDKGDVFEKNHRISRLRISREGVVLADTTLDPETRELQGIDLQADGGDFLVEVLETKPGTEKKWKELTVSEFRVLGFARGAPRTPRSMPRMAVGGLDGIPKSVQARADRPSGTYASIDALCAAWAAAVRPGIDAALANGELREPVLAPYCSLAAVTAAGAPEKDAAKGAFLDARWLQLQEVYESEERLVVQTKEGWSLTPIVLGSRDHSDPGCAHASMAFMEDVSLVRTEMGREVVVVRTMHADGYWAYWDPERPNPSGIVESAYACDVDARGAASCQGPLEVGRYWGWPAGWDNIENKWPTPNPEKVKWSKRARPMIGPAGDLRAEPILAR